MKQVYPDQLNPVTFLIHYIDWYRNGASHSRHNSGLDIGFSASWRHKTLKKIKKPDILTTHLAIL